MKIKFITDGSYYGMESVIGKEYSINDDRVIFEDDTFLGVYGDFLNDITNDEALKDPSFNYLFIIGKEIEILDEDDKPEVETTELDEDKNVNHPDHYNVGGIETLDYIKAKLTDEEYKGYLKGNSIKYLSRAGHKDKERQDVRKCIFYLQRLVEIL